MLGAHMRALVTGGHGFIGTHLVQQLLDEGSAVRCLYRRPGRPASLDGLDVEIVAGDVRRAGGLAAAFEGVDEVHHLAGLTSSITRRAMFETNAEGTRNLLAAATRAGFGGRFVLCSSLSLSGPAPADGAVDETMPPRPLSWYAASKLAAEGYLFEPSLPFAVTSLRPCAVYGPRDLAFLPVFSSAAKGFAVVPGDPRKRYSMIYADDLAAAFIAAARSEATNGGVYYVAHPEVVTLEDLLRAAEQAVGRTARRVRLPASFLRLLGRLVDVGSQVSGRSSVLGSQRMKEVAEGDWVCSTRAFEDAAGWRAAIDVAEGFGRTAAWYREQKLLQ